MSMGSVPTVWREQEDVTVIKAGKELPALWVRSSMPSLKRIIPHSTVCVVQTAVASTRSLSPSVPQRLWTMPVEACVMRTPSKFLGSAMLIRNHLGFRVAALTPVSGQLVKQPC